MSINPSSLPEWGTLKNHAARIKKQTILRLFQNKPNRADDLSVQWHDIYFDYSKQAVTQDVIGELIDILKACDFEKKRNALFAGDIINVTEKQAAHHTALRDPNTSKKEIKDTLARMKEFSNDVREGIVIGATGKPFEKIISIGIGGSDLGPRLVHDALIHQADFPCVFVSNIDGEDIHAALKETDPETTIFLVISKSFGTQETLTNAATARQWLEQALPDNAKNKTGQHFIAVSANPDKVKAFGIEESQLFPMWDWVNGRFSVWSAVGLQLCIALGFNIFEEFLAGAHEADQHFLNTPLEQNIPALMALIGIWNINFMGYETLAVLPYAQRLALLPAYLQQLDMESNGKFIDNNGDKITDYETAPVLFGQAGTNGQHSFYQHLHQGTSITPCDFIGAVKPHCYETHHTLLLQNMLAQSQALMTGQSHDNPYQVFEGNRPSSTFLFPALNAKTLGQLIAFYEHKIFTQGVIWNINSFDQYGVELGKAMARKLEENNLSGADPSTQALYKHIHK